MPAPRHPSMVTVCAFTVTLVLALAACTPASDELAPDAAPAEYESPLSDYLAGVWGGTEQEVHARMEREQREREELIAACMTEHGFEYEPMLELDKGTQVGGAPQPDDVEWVAQWGYGIALYPGMNEPVPAENAIVDPNQEYVESLTGAELAAYHEALFGPPLEAAEVEAGEWDWESSGCTGHAHHAMELKNPLNADEHQPIVEAVNNFWLDLGERGFYAEVDAQWVACIEEAGYSGFERQFDARSSINAALEELYAAGHGWSADDPKLIALAEQEVELALADLECRTSVGFSAAIDEIRIEQEEQFIIDNRAALDALLASAEQGE